MYLAKSVCSGAVICDAFVVRKKPLEVVASTSCSKKEIERYRSTLKQFERDTYALIKNADMAREQSLILERHIMIANDPEIFTRILAQIEKEFVTCEVAVINIFEKFSRELLHVEDELTKARAIDLEDIKIRLIEILMGAVDITLESIDAPCILIARELTPSEMMRIDRDKIKGIITEEGAVNSHMSIMARSLGIPTAVGAQGLLDVVRSGDEVAMNITESRAEIIVSPSKEDSARINALMRTVTLRDGSDADNVGLNGINAHVYANINIPKDLDEALLNAADGIGLFRSEFLFLGKTVPPDENEQFEAYKKAARAFLGKPVTIRTFDIGADKEVSYLEMKTQPNPALGLRGIRLCLSNTALFMTQLRAILRASAYGNVRIMIPMITTLIELREAKILIEEAKDELEQQKIPFNKDIPVGIMIETPSAAIMADILAKECDFFSIGTNDLTQYIMCADRLSDEVEHIFSIYQPAVMRTIYSLTKAGKNAGIKVCVCGEAAVEPNMAMFLLACGIDEFSVAARSVRDMRKIVYGQPLEDLAEIVQSVLNMETKEEIINYLEQRRLR